MNDIAKTPELNLQQIQQWMQAVITHPGGIESGIDSPEAREQIAITAGMLEQVVSPSLAQSGADRLAIYGNAYYARLLECMRALFPALVYAIGEDTFDQFAFGYLQAYPPKSYTLGRLAESFVTYLDETRPGNRQSAAPNNVRSEDADWTDFIVDLARLEWTIDLVFDGPGIENEHLLTPAALREMSPAQWSSARLVPAPCLRLLSCRFPVNEYFTHYRQESRPRIPPPKRTFVAVTRRKYCVRRFDLSRDQYALLVALIAGSTVGDAIAQLAESCDEPEQLGVNLRNWFETWGAVGFFLRVAGGSGPQTP